MRRRGFSVPRLQKGVRKSDASQREKPGSARSKPGVEPEHHENGGRQGGTAAGVADGLEAGLETEGVAEWGGVAELGDLLRVDA